MRRFPISIAGTPDPRWFLPKEKTMHDQDTLDGFFIPNLGWDDDDTPSQGWKKDEKKDETAKSNQGRATCFKCGTKTVKIDTGMFSVYDICPKCKI